jgi:hypothetical protein
MSSASDYLEGQLANALLRGGTYTGGAVYFALFTADPTDAGTGAELADSAYARQQAHTTTVADGFDAPHATNGNTANAKVVTFPAIVDAQVVVTHWGLYDAPTGGNLIIHNPLTNQKTLDPSDVFSFPVGAATVTFS